MADVEMDLDTRNHDDQIDYDLDIDITHDQEATWDVEDVEIREAADELPEMNVQMEESGHLEHDFPSDAMDTLEAGITAGVAKSDADMLSNADPNEIIAIDHAIEQDQEVMTSGETEDIAIGETFAATTKPHEEAPHDPDYLELSDVRDEEPEEITYEEVEAVSEENTVVDANAEEAGPVAVSAVDDTQEPVEAQPHDAINDELTWEDDDAEKDQRAAESKQEDGEERTDLSSQVRWQEVNEQQTAAGQGETEENEQAEHSQVQEQAVVADEAAEVDNVDQEASEPKEEPFDAVGAVQSDAAATHESQNPPVIEALVENNGSGEAIDRNGADNGVPRDGYWPAITVQYKGEEFPCFAAADGFFTQTSVVEETMEKVLAGLRLELTAELAEDEELVFHVDELGLEFAESTQHELLSTTTLRSILDLHEMLIQNQDHDAHAKPLYTYLFTRSSPSKRLEYLMESAANGRGLDEVIHLFEPAILHNHATSHDGDSDVVDDDHGQYPSPGDELHPEYEEISASYGGDDLSTGGEAATETVDDTIHSVQNDHVTVHASNAYDEVDDHVNDASQGGVGEVIVEANSVVPEDEYPAPQGGEEETVQHGTEQSEEPFEVTDDHHQDEDEHNSDSVILPNDDFADEDNLATGNANAESSATSITLDGTEAAVDDLTYNEQPDEDVQVKHDVEDNLAEIDWKDDEDEDEDAVPVTEQSPPAKRTRTEDELDETEENDTKRQRSS